MEMTNSSLSGSSFSTADTSIESTAIHPATGDWHSKLSKLDRLNSVISEAPLDQLSHSAIAAAIRTLDDHALIQPKPPLLNASTNSPIQADRINPKQGAIDRLTGLSEGNTLAAISENGTVETESLAAVAQTRAAGLPYPGHLLKYTPGTPLKYDRAAEQWQARMRERGWSIGVDGLYGPQSKEICMKFQREKGLTADGIVGPNTWAAAFRNDISPTPPLAQSGQELANLAHKVVKGEYNGGRPLQYVFGAENELYHPELIRRTDCSELVQVCVSTLVKNPWVDGSWNQYAKSQKISVEQALRTPGALLFISTNGKIHHVAVSLGNGYTAEARSTKSGVGVFKAGNRFNLAGLVPGLKY